MRVRSVFRLATLFVIGGSLAAAAHADVKPNALFSAGAVLQQGIKVPVWGTAKDGEKVTVKFQGQEVSTTAKDGRWKVELAPLQASAEPSELTISGDNTIKIPGVLVGEVWIASGQSNMQWSVNQSDNPKQTVAESANPKIRLITIPRRATPEPQNDVDAKWVACGPETVGDFSAVAYFFGRDLQKQLNVPVGLISTNYGGTPAEAWTSKESLAAEKSLTRYHGSATDKPNSPSGLYNAMIYPLVPYAIRGAIWYQGESNAGQAYEYRTLFPTMIKDWRAQWKQGDFPFLLVQLAPFMKIDYEPKDFAWAELRDAQLYATQSLPSVGMAVITDVGDALDIHPKWKAPVGGRLALAARALAYGEKIPYSGPEYYQQQIDGDKIVLSFKHTDGGLTSQGAGALYGFTIAGEDKKFVNAHAEIQGDKVVVWSPLVKKPVGVRFGWANYPLVNLWNGAGLPASPFRTDDFPYSTKPK